MVSLVIMVLIAGLSVATSHSGSTGTGT